ncbi:MAG: OmpA family protein [Candidatus Pacebacteria bacterium]|nr:OmpA family protein [Candidatus Paceibacterota bacterium]
MALKRDEAPIIVKRRKRRHEAAHGSQTWKIALADFMTSMFIIFMLLWLIKISSPETRAGIAEYFSPASPSRSSSGSGKPLGGADISSPGPFRSPASVLGPQGGGPATPDTGNGNSKIDGFMGSVIRPMGDRATSITEEIKGRPADLQNQEILATQIRRTILNSPSVRNEIANVKFDTSPQGLRIELVDTNRTPMFAAASSQPSATARDLLANLVQQLALLPNQIVIEGHTDSTDYKGDKKGYSNWELSSDRANAARRMMIELGIDPKRIQGVAGFADTRPLREDAPTDPSNRRLSILLLNDQAEFDNSAASQQPLPIEAPPPAPEGRLIQ